jgi:zinc transport system permease protein
MQLALLAALVIGACTPLVGTVLVHKHLSLMADGLGHIAFAGVAAGLLLNVAPFWTALVVAVAAAIVVEVLRVGGRAGGDMALALIFYSGIAGGVVLSGAANSLNGSALTYLFGSILTVSHADALTVAVIGCGLVVAMALCWRAMFAIIMDEEAAQVAGLPVRGLNLFISCLTAVTVVAGMRIVGVLLVSALMVIPVGAAQRLTRSFRTTMLLASGFGATSAVLGLVAARQWGLAPGGTIVLVAAGLFVVCTAVGIARRA